MLGRTKFSSSYLNLAHSDLLDSRFL